MTRAVAALLALALAACGGPAQRAPIANRPLSPASSRTGPPQGRLSEATLLALMQQRFAKQIGAGTFVADFNGTVDDLLAELAALGITDVSQLAHLIPRDYVQRAGLDERTRDPANIPGVLRDVFIIHDARRYFRDAWNNHWQSLSADNLSMYRAYHVDLDVLVEAGVLDQRAIDASSRPRP